MRGVARSDAVDPLTSFLRVIASVGAPGRELAVRLDLVRATGIGRSWRRLREDAALARGAPASGRSPAYERIWREAAAEVGAEVVDLSDGFLELRRGRAATRVWNHWVMLDDIVTVRLALDKLLVHRLLAAERLPIPEHVEFDASAPAPATAFLASCPAPCVVKPAGGSGGGGVTSGIRTASQFARAVLRGSRLDGRLVIERQIAGDGYRLLFLEDELLDVVRRLPARVVGDGRSSIDELIAAENRRRLEARDENVVSLLRADLDCVFTLAERGLTLAAVPRRGESVVVKRVVSQNRPEDNETVRDGIAPDVVADARSAARTIGLRLAGVDIVTPDPSRSLVAAGGAIVEVNGTPGLHYHYEVADRAAATRVAVPILEKLFP